MRPGVINEARWINEARLINEARWIDEARLIDGPGCPLPWGSPPVRATPVPLAHGRCIKTVNSVMCTEACHRTRTCGTARRTVYVGRAGRCTGVGVPG